MSKVLTRSRSGKSAHSHSKRDASIRNLESIQNIRIDHRAVSIIFMDKLKNTLGQFEDAFVSNDLIQIRRELPLQRICELTAWGMCILWTRHIKWNIGGDYDKAATSEFYIGDNRHEITLSDWETKPLRNHGISNLSVEHIFSSLRPAETIRQVADAVSWEWHHWRNDMASDALRYLAMSEDDRLASLTKSGLKMMYAAFAQMRNEEGKEKNPVSVAAA